MDSMENLIEYLILKLLIDSEFHGKALASLLKVKLLLTAIMMSWK
jgi:hypothetical protein